jgi:SOS-response transcriptional repressor LexA
MRFSFPWSNRLPGAAMPRGFHRASPVCAYLPSNHPVIQRYQEGNMYTDNIQQQKEFELNDSHMKNPTARMADPNSYASGLKKAMKSFQINDNEFSPVRQLLKAQSEELMRTVFFFNESNPHSGFICNIRQLLFDYYQLIGPVKNSWSKILLKDKQLLDLLSFHIHQSGKSSSTSFSKDNITVASIATMLERIATLKDVSSCKYKSAVTVNTMQFRSSKLSPLQLVILEVLAQYAFIDYEIILSELT